MQLDRAGKRRLKTFGLKKDADAWWARVNNELAEGTHVPDSKITVAALFKLWIDD